MNRTRADEAAEHINTLIDLFTSNSGAIKRRVQKVGRITILYIKPTKEDMSRLIGTDGIIYRELSYLGRAISGDEPFDLEIEEPSPTEVNRRSFTPCKMAKVEDVVKGIMESLFSNGVKIVWNHAESTSIASVEIQNETTFPIDRLNAAIQVICNAIGRTHQKRIKVWIIAKQPVR